MTNLTSKQTDKSVKAKESMKNKKMCISTKDGGQIFACSNCYTEVDHDANFCPECGNNIEEVTYRNEDTL